MRLFTRSTHDRNDLELVRAYLAGIVTGGRDWFYRSHIVQAFHGDDHRAMHLVALALERGFAKAHPYLDNVRVIGSDRPIVTGEAGVYELTLENGRRVSASSGELMLRFDITESFRDAHRRKVDHVVDAALV